MSKTPEAPHAAAPHEIAIAAMLDSANSKSFLLSMQLSSHVAFATYAVYTEVGVGRERLLVIEAQLPCPPLSAKEQQRFCAPATPPRFVMRFSESLLCSVLVQCHRADAELAQSTRAPFAFAPEQAVLLMVAELLAGVSHDPILSRPFAVNLIAAIASLADVTANMLWQSLAVTTDRVFAQRTRRVLKAELAGVVTRWGNT